MGSYQWLKSMYNQLFLIKSPYTKNQIRSAVSTLTYIYEIQNNDTHISAFAKAIDEIKHLIITQKLLEEREKYKQFWLQNKYIQTISNTFESSQISPQNELIPLKHNDKNVISLFSGAMGLDLGFLLTGYNIKYTLDIDSTVCNTINANLPNVICENKNIIEITGKQILLKTNLDQNQIDLLIGGAPCQPFSSIGKRQGFDDQRSIPLIHFIRLLNELQPKAFVLEEVPGILTCKSTIDPYKKVIDYVIAKLSETNYHFNYCILNSADFGSPQIRKRVIFIGMQNKKPFFPSPTYSNSDNKLKPYNTLWEAIGNTHSIIEKNNFIPYTFKIQNIMKLIPPGGNWKDLPDEIAKNIMQKAYYASGGKSQCFRRLTWDEPSPTLQTDPNHKLSMLGHPTDLRSLNLFEYKRLQGFPDNWKLCGTLSQQFKQIGNAVPIHLSYAIAKCLLYQI